MILSPKLRIFLVFVMMPLIIRYESYSGPDGSDLQYVTPELRAHEVSEVGSGKKRLLRTYIHFLYIRG